MEDPKDLLPLAPAAFHILISLADRERHGYAILQEVAERTDGEFSLGPATLYTNIKRLVENGLIEEQSSRRAPDDERRRYYRLTRFGRQVALAELDRLQAAVRKAKVLLAKGVVS